MYELERYYVKNIGKRRVNRGKDTPRDGKKTWYVAFEFKNGSVFLVDTSIFGAFIWKLRKTFTRYHLNTDDYDEE